MKSVPIELRVFNTFHSKLSYFLWEGSKGRCYGIWVLCWQDATYVNEQDVAEVLLWQRKNLPFWRTATKTSERLASDILSDTTAILIMLLNWKRWFSRRLKSTGRIMSSVIVDRGFKVWLLMIMHKVISSRIMLGTELKDPWCSCFDAGISAV